MASMFRTAIFKTYKFARRLFSNMPEDTIDYTNEELFFSSNGSSYHRSVQELQHVSLNRSVLGLFGSSIRLKFNNDETYEIKGLSEKRAVFISSEVDKKLFEIAVQNAEEKLLKSQKQISKAYKALQFDEYISAWQIEKWKEKFSELRFLSALSVDIVLSIDFDEQAIECRDAFLNSAAWLKNKNDKWIQKEMEVYSDFFDTVCNFPLSLKQREAILSNDNRVLTVAGAGTGKTTTVIGKVAYLLEKQLYKPNEILLLSFSNGAVGELQERISEICRDDIEVKTFHKLGMDIIREVERKKPAVHDQEIENFISRCLINLMNDSNASRQLINYLAFYYYPPKRVNDFKDENEYLQYANSLNIQTLDQINVKSYQEAQIGTFLFLNGIKYKYESKYKGAKTGSYNKRVYKPDFYLPDYDIYIEHFGINENGQTAPWIDQEEYLEGMKWKKLVHQINKTPLIETFSYEATKGELLSGLEEKLKKQNVKFKRKTREEIKRDKKIRDRLRSTSKLFATTLSLFKSDNITVEDLKSSIVNDSNPETRSRYNIFLELFQSIVFEYDKYLKERGEIDYGDMIINAAGYVEAKKYKSKYKVIVVDEFQDISRGRAWLVNTLLEQVEDSRLLCVGDDWQSIYRFTGSDVNLMTDYKNKWPESVRVDLDESFRFNNKIQDLSEAFITKNPVQLTKSIQCKSHRDEAAVHITEKTLSEIYKKIQSRAQGSSVLLLNRYNFNSIKHKDSFNGQIMTVHKAKGKEADFVIIDEVKSGTFGFPNEMVDDPIIQLFLTDQDSFTHGEERRLFYVALTRAKKEVWIRAIPGAVSPFIAELITDPIYSGLITVELLSRFENNACEICKGCMVMKSTKQGKIFLSCENYPRCSYSISGCPECGKSIPKKSSNSFKCSNKGCNWSGQICPRCKAGYLHLKKGKNGLFFGCSAFESMNCRHTKSIESESR